MFRCPADRGDPILRVRAHHCYTEYGTSYLGMWAMNYFGIQKVTDRVGGTPIKGNEVALSPVNKIIQGDWNWPPNRPQHFKQSVWHNFKSTTGHLMLYGDLHADYWKLPKDMEADQSFQAPPARTTSVSRRSGSGSTERSSATILINTPAENSAPAPIPSRTSLPPSSMCVNGSRRSRNTVKHEAKWDNWI